jgi:hypothetical protein
MYCYISICTPAPIDEIEIKLYKDLKELAESKVANLSNQQNAIVRMPNSVCSLKAYTWMELYFKSFWKKTPNKEEIHLKYTPFKVIWQEYCNDIDSDTCEEIGWLFAYIHNLCVNILVSYVIGYCQTYFFQ